MRKAQFDVHVAEYRIQTNFFPVPLSRILLAVPPTCRSCKQPWAFSCSKLRFVYFSCLSGISWVMSITADKGHFPLSRGRFMQVNLPFGVDSQLKHALLERIIIMFISRGPSPVRAHLRTNFFKKVHM